MKTLRRMWASGPARTILGIALGALGGALYSHYIGCATGTCPITSNPLSAALFGGVFGGTIFAPGGKPAARQSADQER